MRSQLLLLVRRMKACQWHHGHMLSPLLLLLLRQQQPIEPLHAQLVVAYKATSIR